MTRPAPLPVQGWLITTEDWIKHLMDSHTLRRGMPSPDDMRNYPHVLQQLMAEHQDLHVHFYTGHEHEFRITPLGGSALAIIPGRTK